MGRSGETTHLPVSGGDFAALDCGSIGKGAQVHHYSWLRNFLQRLVNESPDSDTGMGQEWT